MKLEFLFLQKAIKDKNFISFLYQGRKINHVLASRINEKSVFIKEEEFCLLDIKKLQISKERYNV